MNRVALKTEAKKLNQNHVLTLFGIPFVAQMVLNLPVIGFLATIIACGPIEFATSRIFLRHATQKQAPKLKDILFGFEDNNFSRSFFAFWRISIFTLLWSMLLIIPGIVKGLAYSQTMFLLADNPKMDAATAQKKSMELMEGHKMELFILNLSFFSWYLLVLLTFGLASIYVAPYTRTTLALFYKSISK